LRNTEIGPTLSSQIPETNVSFEMYMKFSAQKEFNFSDIHIQEALDEINKLNTSKSVGPTNSLCQPCFRKGHSTTKYGKY
jgi:hypothetical protein